MIYNEPTAELRRIAVYLKDTAGDPVTGATPTGTQLRVSQSGATLVNGAGVWFESGSGVYYYEATQAESRTDSYLFLLVAWPGALVFPLAVDVELDPSLGGARRVPIYLTDDAGAGVSGLTLSGAELAISIDGAAFATAIGTSGASGSGAYYYEPDATEVAVAGYRVLKVNDAGAEIYVFAFDVPGAPAAVEPDPEPVPVPVVFGDPTYVDIVAEGLARLAQQFKGDPE